ncbi:MAG: 3'(2'),5'-bisphosphate nucleotidase CysQ [Pseudomonadales bacterium]
MQTLLDGVASICRDAGAAIIEVYEGTDFDVETKADDSPLTAADTAAHRVIVAGLEKLASDIPVLSEESDDIPWSVRKDWQRYFLVDPLDGTKEFVSRNGEFTVNVALVDNNRPVLGVVFVPVKDVLYAGFQGGAAGESGTAFVEESGHRRELRARNLMAHLKQDKPLTVVASRRHGGDALKSCMARLEATFGRVETKSMGSSLKFCLIADGQADFYPRLAPTSEWDTAAAQAVVEAAGGRVVDTSFSPLRYNTGEDLLNPHFYVIGDDSYGWERVLG